jgi:hypothetical protein
MDKIDCRSILAAVCVRDACCAYEGKGGRGIEKRGREREGWSDGEMKRSMRSGKRKRFEQTCMALSR